MGKIIDNKNKNKNEFTAENKERITILVSEQKKNEMQDFIKTYHISTVSKLIREAIDFYFKNYHLNNSLSKFINGLKEPLTTIKGFSDILINEYWDKLSLDVVLKLRDIYESSLSIEERINYILEEDNQDDDQIDILIVDDNKSIQNVLMSFFKFRGVTCRSVSLGVEAIRILQKIKPKIILIDINLPDINGYEVCRTIKTDEYLTKIPIFLITTNVEGEIIGKVKEIGIDGYFLKPFNFEEFGILFNFLKK